MSSQHESDPTRSVLTMIPGPTPVHERILGRLSQPTTSHVAPVFVERFSSCLGQLRKLVRTEEAEPFIVAGAGTLAMEMGLVNLLECGQRLLVLSHGYFGDRWGDLAAAFGIEAEIVKAEWGQAVPPEELARRLDAGSFSAVAMTHVDTSTGTASPMEQYAEVLRGRDELKIVDGVCATAGMDERFDDWQLDVLLTGAQKALGAPPGVAILLVSRRAMARRQGRERVPAYYADLMRWKPIMDNPGAYFSTPAVNEVVALAEAIDIVLEEGLDRRFARHRRIASAVRAGLQAIGLETFTDRSCLADTLSVVRYPEGIDDAKFRGAMAARKVIVANALGPIAGKAVRVGHMGNIGVGEVTRLLQAAEDSLAELGHEGAPGAALAAAAPMLNQLG